jgi:hypothetical protein
VRRRWRGSWELRWPLLWVSVALFGIYVGLSEQTAHSDRLESPRGFIAGLAAMTLGAWLYGLAAHRGRRDDDDDDDEPEQ